VRTPLAIAFALLAIARPARSDDISTHTTLRPVTDWNRALPDPDGTADEADDKPAPRIRLEAYLRVAPVLRSVVKQGRGDVAHAWNTDKDAHVPHTPALGERLVIDVKVQRWITLGGSYSRVVLQGRPRALHFTGVSLEEAFFSGQGPRVATSLDIQTAEAWARLVVSDDDHVRFAIGIGAAWTSHRVTLHRGDIGASGRVQTTFVPTLTYFLSVRLGRTPASFFLESCTGVFAPWRFPSLYSDQHLGLRVDLGYGLEGVFALALTSAQVEDTDDLWGGQKPSASHRFRQATYLAPAVELGLAWTFGN
jgi:hypothetical protein